MAAFDSKHMSVVVSGGGDITPMVMPLREHGKENLRALSGLPHEPPVVSASRARLLVSWWNKTISIWRIARQPAPMDSDPNTQRPRKLVAKVALNTLESLRSVAISHDGRLLAASTSSDVKVFQLRKRSDTDALSIKKLDLPRTFSTLGARVLNFSPDGKWLAAITPDSEVHLARFAPDPEKLKALRCLPETIELDRHHRKTAPQTAFQTYDRTITRVAFADDGAVLVASDLSGYLDSWVLLGHDDPTAPAIDIAAHDSQKGGSNAGSESDSSSDDSDDEDDKMVIFYGQHWTENPATHLLPKLESAPLVLTFRPNNVRAGGPQQAVNGNPGIHSTRSNPHAHSHELPTGPYHLLVVTARHQMHEFDLLQGRLSEWSRRNPTILLPDGFSKLRDRVMGGVWYARGRLWVYGCDWMGMLDVSKDFEERGEGKAGRSKRKQSTEASPSTVAMKRVKAGTGAGSRVPGADAGGMVRRFEGGEWSEVDPASSSRSGQVDAYDDEDNDEESAPLTRLQSSQAVESAEDEEPTQRWWCTLKYRPILGMVALEDEDEDQGAGGKGNAVLEVVLIERPLGA